jgi:hypothetical protein
MLSSHQGKGEKRSICWWVLTPCPMPACTKRFGEGRRSALSVVLYTDGEFDEEGRAFGFVVPYPDISTVIGDDGVDNDQP